MIPKWWTAYNNIKHDFSNYAEYATLENALRSICAVAILIYKVYGPGVTIGKADWYEITNGQKGHYIMENSTSELFFNRDGRIIMVY